MGGQGEWRGEAPLSSSSRQRTAAGVPRVNVTSRPSTKGAAVALRRARCEACPVRCDDDVSRPSRSARGLEGGPASVFFARYTLVFPFLACVGGLSPCFHPARAPPDLSSPPPPPFRVPLSLSEPRAPLLPQHGDNCPHFRFSHACGRQVERWAAGGGSSPTVAEPTDEPPGHMQPSPAPRAARACYPPDRSVGGGGGR